MQATPDADPRATSSQNLQQRANRLPEYAYQVAILVVVALLIWTVA